MRLDRNARFHIECRQEIGAGNVVLDKPIGIVLTPIFPLSPNAEKKRAQLRLAEAQDEEREGFLPNESDKERLARIEEKFNALSETIKNFIFLQNELNKTAADVHKVVSDMQSRAKGAWWMAVQMATIASVLAGFVAWVIAQLTSK